MHYLEYLRGVPHSASAQITDTPVSFNGGVWPSLSLPCLGFLRALLYNPLLPLHLRGPPPPPPYGQPTAERMLKHPWLQQCFREERRRETAVAATKPTVTCCIRQLVLLGLAFVLSLCPADFAVTRGACGVQSPSCLPPSVSRSCLRLCLFACFSSAACISKYGCLLPSSKFHPAGQPQRVFVFACTFSYRCDAFVHLRCCLCLFACFAFVVVLSPLRVPLVRVSVSLQYLCLYLEICSCICFVCAFAF